MLSTKQCFAIRAAAFGSIGGLLFGYDLGVISGALPNLTEEFQLSTTEQEMVVSLMVLGCFIGAIFGGYVCDRIGRLKTFYLVNFVFLTGSLILGFTTNIVLLFIGRIIIGAGVSISAIVDITYLTEISPIEYRGAVVSTNELMITIGLLVAFLVGYWTMNITHGWRYMFLLPVPVTVVWTLLMMFMPESPRWLLVQGRLSGAMEVYRRTLGVDREAEKAFNMALLEVDRASRGAVSALWTEWKLASIVSIALTVLAQFSGNACVLSYTPEIFRRVNMTPKAAALSTIALGVTKVVVTMITIPMVDRVGRKLLLLIGVAGVLFALIVMSAACYVSDRQDSSDVGYVALSALCLFVASYSVGYGPINWLVTSEMFPDELRGRALGMVGIVNWGSNVLVAATFLTLVEATGTGGTFTIYSICTVIAAVVIYKVIPETTGRSCTEILRDIHIRLGATPPMSVCASWREDELRVIDVVEGELLKSEPKQEMKEVFTTNPLNIISTDSKC
eukprot:CAMPEP_0182429380 /NCGR_PEP_ID=MMETSP1167-20130531/27486_1 /TAXON_ID=2988 /ORGANISM="Mallomonas Sp, Strain CCMP3275" /LENGTH=504 /DNA_ID=CAMNT_0024612967 /DNA_START=226 /DNA_END=1740 /DNA_ORIENTATION=-